MMMKRISSLIGLIAACVVSAFAQMMDPVHFTVQQKQVSDSEFEVVFSGTTEAGWHVYGSDVADGGPTRAELTLESSRGVAPKGKLQMRGKVIRTMDELFGMQVSYMEGKVIFAQKFSITEPKYDLAGYLTYGACNDQNCMPPTHVEFSFSGTRKVEKPQEREAQKGL